MNSRKLLDKNEENIVLFKSLYLWQGIFSISLYQFM